MAGVARESVRHVLTEWRKNKVVTQAEQYHHIQDMAALRRETAL